MAFSGLVRAASAFSLALIAAAQSPDQTRQSFLRLIDRPRVPLGAQTKLLNTNSDLETHTFSFDSEAAQRVPGLIVKPAASAGRLPTVIVLHGTGGNKDRQEPLLRDLAARGFIAVAIDGRYHGARSQAGAGSADYVAAILRRYRTGKELPFLYDTVWDVLRLLDYLETRADVDPKRIGAIGFSKGGMELYLAAAVDPRIAVAVPCIGVQSFRWALDHDAWQSRAGTFRAALEQAAQDASVPVDAAFLRRFYDRVAPGVYSDFDGPRMTPLIAPRPLLVINGDSDARTPMPGLLECVNAARSAYRQAGAADAFRFFPQENTAHKVTPEAMREAIAWFSRWLAGAARTAR